MNSLKITQNHKKTKSLINWLYMEELLRLLVQLYVSLSEDSPGISTKSSEYKIESLIKLIEKQASITEASLPELSMD